MSFLNFFTVNNKTKLHGVHGMHTRASGSEQNLTSVFLLIGGLGEAKMEDEFVLEMWELKLVFKSQINPKKLRKSIFPSSVWRAFKAAHSWTSAVRRKKCRRVAKDILVIKLNQAGTTASTSSINLRMT